MKLFNLIAKEDANVSMEVAKDSRTIALDTKHDSSSMTTIAFMTMAFLPATFFAAFFAMPSLQHLRLWVYWATTIPVTLLVFVTWHLVMKRVEIWRKIENQRQRAAVMKRVDSAGLGERSDSGDANCHGIGNETLVRKLQLWTRARRKDTKISKDGPIEIT
jgi:heme exporter protein D